MILPWEFEPFETARLRIRLMAAGDLDDVHAYLGREDVATYLPFGALSREEVAERIRGYAERTRLEDDDDWVQPAIEVEGHVIGHLMLAVRSVRHRGGEIGWTLHPDAQGRGYATEAAAALLGIAFEAIGLHRVHAELDPRNAASIALCRRLGMREEAHRVRDFRDERVPGGWTDTGVWAILDEEWAGRRR